MKDSHFQRMSVYGNPSDIFLPKEFYNKNHNIFLMRAIEFFLIITYSLDEVD